MGGVKLERRELLALGIGGGALLLSGIGATGCGSETTSNAARDLLQPGLLGARRLGRAYLADHPDEATPEALRELLAPLPASGLDLDDAGTVEWLDARSRADFSRGRTVRVDGYWLSKSEARLCALLSLE